MRMFEQIPTANGPCFEPYLIAARRNLDAMLKLAKAQGDDEFVEAAQSLLDGFDDYAADCQQLIDMANDHSDDEPYDNGQWRNSQYAIDRGFGEGE